MGSKRTFQTKHGIAKRLFSFILVFAMLITSGIPGGVIAKAASTVNLYFKLPDNTQASDWGVNYWQNGSLGITESGESKVVGGTWGTTQSKPSLKAGDDGWGYITVTINSEVDGLQFVQLLGEDADSSSVPTVYSCWNAGLSTVENAYFDPTSQKWYEDAAFNKEITAPVSSVASTDLTVHFENSKNWSQVYGQVAAGGSWNPIEGLEYCKNGYGAVIQPNSKNSGWYSYRITKSDSEAVKGLFNNGSWGQPDNQTANYSISITEETMEVWLTWDTDKTDGSLIASETAPAGWISGATVSAPVNPADLSGFESPVINEDGSVSFYYEVSADALAGNKLYLMGTLTDWDNGVEMTDEDGDGIYSVTITDVKPGKYQYKFKYGSNWVTDPSNDQYESGNSLLVVPGFVMECENPAGVGTFEITATVTDDIQKDTIEWSVADEEGKPVSGITIAKDETDATKAVITTTDEAKTGYFIVTADYQQDGRGQQQSELTLYYTEKAFLYEYEYKSGSEWTGKSDIYTWYNSKAGNTGAKFREVNDAYMAYITLDDTTTNFGYIVRLPGKWGASEAEDREFTDRTLTVYEDDRYTKVKGGEGIEVPYLLPSGKTGYDNGILFAWRDDEKFYNNDMDSLKDSTVNVVITDENGQTVTEKMTYNEKDELFTYHYTGIETGTYSFYFTVDGKRVEDQYWNGSIPYEKPELEIKATVSPKEVNYDQNPVVTFSITDKKTGKDVEVSSIVGDITNLGYSGQTVTFQPLSKEGVLYVDRSVAAGTYEIPFTITDLFGNTIETTVSVNVAERTDSDAAWDESRIYFLLTDRFVDGNTSNNYNCDKTKIEAYHGGDFKGLTSKLGYLQELGINTIWITPIVDNIDQITNSELHQQGYHGYWAKDFTSIDEHLGDTTDLDNLIDEADKRGIKIMVDIVVNHAGYGTEDQSNFAGMLRTEEDEVEGDVILGELDGLPDFRTEDAETRSKLIAWQTAWANHTTPSGNRIAYFRVDTVKHVDHDTWQDLKTSLAKVNPAFKMIGEYYGASVSNTGDYLGNGQMDALLDFDFKNTALSFVNGSIDSVEASLEARNQKMSNSLTMGQFLSSHDEDGFLYRLDGDTAKMKVAAALQMTAKGTPIIYYGEEINLTGANAFGDQSNNRYDMQFDNLTDEQTAMQTHYKKLLAARAMYSDVFATGTRTKISGSDSDGYLVFKRSTGSENIYVGINTTGTAQEVTFSVTESGLTDIYSGEPVEVSGGKVTVTIPANADGGTVILAKGKELTDVVFQGPIKTSYYVGEELNLDGITATGVYEGGVKVSIAGYTVDDSSYDKSKSGTYKITVAYGEYSEEYQITVSERPVSGGSSASGDTAGTTKTETLSDGTVVTTATKTDAAGNVTETVTKEKTDGTKTEEVTVTSADGSVVKTTTNTDSKGDVTSVTSKSAFTPAADTTATVTIKKDGTGTVTSAKSTLIVKENAASKAILSGDVVSQLTQAAGQTDLPITVTVVKSDSTATAYKVSVNANDLKSGNKLYIYVYNSKTGEYTMVDSKTYKVGKDGSLTVSMKSNKNYVLVDAAKAKKINKNILSTIKPKKSSVTLKKGKKTNFALSSKANTENIKKITYTTSNKSVATVSKKGKITAKKAGTVTIKAKVTLKNGSTKTIKMKVKVKK